MNSQIQYFRRMIYLLIGLFAFSACTSKPDVVREITQDLADQVEILNGEMTRYQKTLQKESSARVKTLAIQRALLRATERDHSAYIQLMKLTREKEELEYYSGIITAANQLMNDRKSMENSLKTYQKTLFAAQQKYQSQQKALAKLVKILNELNKTPDLKEQLNFAHEFINTFSQQIKEPEK